MYRKALVFGLALQLLPKAPAIRFKDGMLVSFDASASQKVWQQGGKCCCRSISKEEQCQPGERMISTGAETENGFCCSYTSSCTSRRITAEDLFPKFAIESQRKIGGPWNLCKTTCCCGETTAKACPATSVFRAFAGDISSSTTSTDSLKMESEDVAKGYCCAFEIATSCSRKTKPALTLMARLGVLGDENRDGREFCNAVTVGESTCTSHEDCEGLAMCADTRGRWGSSKTCQDVATPHAIGTMLEEMTWTLMFTSSGGGGHISAAKAMTNEVNSKLLKKLLALLPVSQGNSRLAELMMRVKYKETVTHGGYEAEVIGSVVLVNIMKSPCVDVLYGDRGAQMTNAWDEAMRNERFQAMQEMIRATESTSNTLERVSRCAAGMEKFVRSVAHSQNFDAERPNRLLDTQPLLKGALAKVGRKLGASVYDVHITDFPSDRCIHFTGPFSQMADHDAWGFARSRLFVPKAPRPHEDKDWFAKLSGWFGLEDPRQFVIQNNLPTLPDFSDPTNKLPGQAATVSWKSQVSYQHTSLTTATNSRLSMPPEQQVIDEGETYFNLGGRANGDSFEFDVAAEDRVGLVMLGSQPPRDTVNRIVEIIALWALEHEADKLNVTLSDVGISRQRTGFTDPEERLFRTSAWRSPRSSRGKAWLFVACGPKKNNQPPEGMTMTQQPAWAVGTLYFRIKELVENYRVNLNMLGIATGDEYLTIVPFTGQPALKVFARADVALIKTGGMSAAEGLDLVELDRRTDVSKRGEAAGKKKILMVSWSAAKRFADEAIKRGSCTTTMPSGKAAQDWARVLTSKGQLAHEGGNADYLRDRIGAVPVCVAPTKAQLKSAAESDLATIMARSGILPGIAATMQQSLNYTARSRSTFTSQAEHYRAWFFMCEGPFVMELDTHLWGNFGGPHWERIAPSATAARRDSDSKASAKCE